MSELDLCFPIIVPITILIIILVVSLRNKRSELQQKYGCSLNGLMPDGQTCIPASDFALEKNKASLSIIACFLVLFAYALIDYFIVNQNLMINSNRDLWYAPVLALSVIPAHKYLKANKVPDFESLSLSVLLAISVLSAYSPAIQRIDQMLSDGVHSYEYILRPEASFEPKSNGAPPIKGLKPKEYWAQFKEGSIHRFDLIHGPLNVWQMETTKTDKELKEFFEKQKLNKKVM